MVTIGAMGWAGEIEFVLAAVGSGVDGSGLQRGADGRMARRTPPERRRRADAGLKAGRGSTWSATIPTTTEPWGFGMTGPTNTNVMDVRLILVASKS